jgi:hypothetical protein
MSQFIDKFSPPVSHRQSHVHQSIVRRVRGMVLMLLAATSVSVPLSVSAASGSFTYVTGPVFVETAGRRVPATRGMEVNPGDIIVAESDAMAQLSMIDQAKLSLRSNSRLVIESYSRTAAGQDGAVLNLLRGTLRTFTGLLTAANRDRYQMKTRVATIGIRGSGNIVSHEEEEGKPPVTINHTIEGSHIISSVLGSFAPIITFPNDTVKVESGKPPERIPTPPAILAASNTMVAKEEAPAKAADASAASAAAAAPAPAAPAPTPATAAASAAPAAAPAPVVNIVPSVVIPTDPSGLRDIVMAGSGNTYSGQANASGLTLEGSGLRAFTGVPGGGGTNASITGGSIAESQTIDIGNRSTITIGRWNAPTRSSFAGIGAVQGAGATTHFAYGGSGYPAYLSDVLTGTVVYQRVGATSPTNLDGASGVLNTSVLNVNFTSRTLNASLGLTVPGASGSVSYTIQATNVPFTLNSFFALTGFGLSITNTTPGATPAASANIFGTLEGSFVGAALSGAIVAYAFTDGSPSGARGVNGVVAFQAPAQDANAPYQYGLISDVNQTLAGSPYSRTYSTINRPSEVTAEASGRVSAFRGAYARANGTIDGNARYAIGSAQALDVGTDATTGLSWGRWSGGIATIGGVETGLAARSLHYIFSAPQTGPTTLPLTGTAVYEVAGATRPTDTLGNVGNMNTATLNANFTARTVEATVNLSIANRTWNASATGMPIYRDLTFGANTGGPLGNGLPAPTQLILTCAPACGGGATGSIDGFFAGRTGQGAGLQYNINNGITGAVAFRRRGG